MRRVILLLLFLFLSPRPSPGQGAAQWRLFKVGEGSAASVTIGPRGAVWVRHNDAGEVTKLDGYRIQRIPAPDSSNYRIYEGRAGQLWSLYAEGLMLYERGQWSRHPVNEIRADIQSNPLSQLRQISLIPAEINHVFFLLPDRLMEYDASLRRARVVRLASETSLGKFSEMQEARDGGAWVGGFGGLAKLPTPVRRLSSDSVWNEIPLDNSVAIRNLQRPSEDANGLVSMSGSEPRDDNHRAIVSYGGGQWTFRPVTGEKIRQGWTTWDGTAWAYTYNSLLRLDRTGQTRREGVLGAQYDMAMETNGVFWMATSEGLVRYAPYLWRTPPELSPLESPIHAMLADSEEEPGRLWFTTTDGLIELKDRRTQFHRWPETLEPFFHSIEAMHRLPGKRLVIAGAGHMAVFEEGSREFREVYRSRGERLKLLGAFKDGSVCVRVSGTNNTIVLEKFDGANFTPFHEVRADSGLGPELFFMNAAENGDIWLGGTGAVGVLRKSEKSLEIHGPGRGFLGDRAVAFLEVSEGKFWCASPGRIFEFNGKKWEPLRGGLDRISSLARGKDGRAWVGTSLGVYRHLNGSWILNDVDDGLPSSVVHQVMVDSRGNIWAGTSRGTTLFHPDADLDPPRTFAPVLLNVETPSTERLTTLSFTGMDKWQYTPEIDLLFATRMDEGPWSPFAKASTKTFEKLGPGNHHFEVKAMDRNGNEDLSTAHLDFAVIVPFYKDPRLLAVSVCGFVLIVLLAGLAVNRHVQLLRSYAEVEKIVAQRTRELERANQELLHSQKMRALGTLAAGIAHDFNNILSVIKGSAQIIEHHVDDKEKIHTRVERIKMVVEQGSGIVRSMLGLGRITEKELGLCDMAEVVDESLKLVADRLPPEVEMTHEHSGPFPRVLCSRELIHQMLLNLILNALDATGGKGEIRLRTELLTELPANEVLRPSDAPRFIAISVEDNGVGITPEVLPRIFEPFYTTKAFSTRRGTGLGLSMVYELAKSVGYGLLVESKPGKGSRFQILIPVT